MRKNKSEFLCNESDLEATGAVGVERPIEPFEIVVVRSRHLLRAYVNSCPHKGTPLELFPDRFLDDTRTQLICSTHGARFNVSNGICTFGPCVGEALVKLDIEAVEDGIYFKSRQPDE